MELIKVLGLEAVEDELEVGLLVGEEEDYDMHRMRGALVFVIYTHQHSVRDIMGWSSGEYMGSRQGQGLLESFQNETIGRWGSRIVTSMIL